jgi:2-polyprenyl-6-methoxyphenol hydroxylase-like FAD-dependent oxidoreductase
MERHMNLDADVVVVGAGPSGLTVASELARRGVRTLVLERRTKDVESRAGTVMPRVLELFEARGIADRFIRKTAEIQKNPFRPVHIYAGLKYVKWHAIASRFGFTLALPQNSTEEILRGWAVESGADIRLGTEVVGLSQHGDHVKVECEGEGEKGTLLARYVIGADGGRSIVRKSVRIPFEGHDGTFTGMVVDTHLVAPWAEGYAGNDNDKGWFRGFTFGKGITRFNIVHRDSMKAPKEQPIALSEVKACLHDIAGEDFGVHSIQWASRYTDAMRSVPTLRDNRVFLVGESARIHYPASGVGMNFCIQDAFNLGWKIAAVLKGQSPEEILDTYQAERMPVLRKLLDSVEAQCAMQFNFSKEGVALRRRFESIQMPVAGVNRKLALELSGLEEAYESAESGHLLSGRPAPDLELVFADGKRTRTYELLRDAEWLLLDLDGFGVFDELETHQMPVRIVKACAPVRSAGLEDLSALLVRPDAYVAWATNEGANADDARRHIRKWLHLNQ